MTAKKKTVKSVKKISSDNTEHKFNIKECALCDSRLNCGEYLKFMNKGLNALWKKKLSK